jgi:hypothetical protein
MKSNNRIILFVVIGILLLGLIAFFALQSQGNEYRWYPRYQHDGRQPYDLAYLQEILEESYDFERYDEHKIPEQLIDEDPKNSTYFFIGSYPYHQKKEAEALYEFMQKGGTAFLVCNNPPDSLFRYFISEYDCQDQLLDNRRLSSINNVKIEAILNHPSLINNSFDFYFKKNKKDTAEHFWPYIDNYYICEASDYPFDPLGYFYAGLEGAEYVNFIRIKIGEGYLYWHTNPILFSNLYLAEQNKAGEGRAYLEKIFLHFDSKRLLWDHASVNPDYSDFTPPSNYSKPPTPMEYIFSQPALRWAWLILLGMTVLYALFGAKRRQRPIPIEEGNRNTSLEFVRTIGRLYYQQQNHKVIFEKLMELYLSHLRQRYHILVRDLNDPAIIQRIVERSDVDQAIVENIFSEYNRLHAKLEMNKNIEMTADTLNNFYAALERFYIAEEARKFQKS